MTLGQNFQLKDQKLSLTPSPWLIPITEGYPTLEQEYIKRVRTNKKANSQIKEKALVSITENWRAIWGSNPGHPA